MKIKKGDTVVVVKGAQKGVEGEVLRAMPTENKVVVKGVHMATIHQKARVRGEKGEIIKQERPINASNVAVIDPKNNKRTRVGYQIKDGKKQRIAKKSNAVL